MRALIATILAASALLLLPSTSAIARVSGDVLFDRHGVNQSYFTPSPTGRKRTHGRGRKRTHRDTQFVAHPMGCPHTLFCGCGVARHLGLRDRSLWLAGNWLRFPRAAAAPGMVAARHGHVFAIIRVIRPGLVLAYDPNSGGHRTRVHERSLAGFIVVNPRRGRHA